MEEQNEKKQGHKVKGQKYKSLLVWDTLLKKTDEIPFYCTIEKNNQHIKNNDKNGREIFS